MNLALRIGVLIAGTFLPLAAQTRASLPPHLSVADGPFAGLWIDEPSADGELLVRGSRYVATFVSEGVVYCPLFGPRMPHHYPLRLRLLAVRNGAAAWPLTAATPQRAGSRVSFARGPCLEHWDLHADHLQQSFELATLPESGGLAVAVAVQTDLTPTATDDGGLRFSAAGFGAVSYGAAVAIDATGRSWPLPTLWRDGTIVIEVSPAVIAAARPPLLIDPLIQTLSIDNSASSTAVADVAYDKTNDVWLVAYQEKVAGSDTNIKCRRFRGDGTLLDTVFAESSTTNAFAPAVGNNATAGQFLIAWVHGEQVFGRTRSAASTTQGPVQQINNGAGALGPFRVAVGGASRAGDRDYLVAWDDHAVIGTTKIRARTVSTSGQHGPEFNIEAAAGCNPEPRITRSAGTGGHWLVTWSKRFAILGRCINGDVHFAIVGADGSLVQASTPLANGNRDETDPDAAGDGDQFVVVWQEFFENQPNETDVIGALLRRNASGTWVAGSVRNLSAGELGNDTLHQFEPRIAYDGCHYRYAYLEGGPAQPFAATLRVNAVGQFILTERHVALASGTTAKANLSLAAAVAPSVSSLAVWDTSGGTSTPHVEGALYDAVSHRLEVVQTFCRSSGARITVTPDAAGNRVTARLDGVSGLPLLMVGFAAATPLPICPAASGPCALGIALPPLASAATDRLTVTLPCGSHLIGARLAFQAFDVTAGDCAQSLFGIPFGLTDTVVLTVQ